MFDITTAEGRKALAAKIKEDINQASVDMLGEGPRSHLGASVIGNECYYYLWLGFHWLAPDKFEGRMLRLFDRGKREEEFNIRILRHMGFDVWEVDPTNNKQFRIHGAKGHFGGSLDGVIRMPAAYETNMPLLVEFKTANNKQFAKVVELGVALHFPKYYAQMCAYGEAYGFQYALYWTTGKNDDDIHIEIVALDWDFGKTLTVKANEIIFAKQPPEKISESPTAFVCRYCSKVGVCHNGEPGQKNCRACRHSEAIDDGQWQCVHPAHPGAIPTDFIPRGCDDFLSLLDA